MHAEIDCAAVTDHNSGVWVDRLKAAYNQMKDQSHLRRSSDGFRELVIFPEVEFSVQGGFHLLALFGSEFKTSDIDILLGLIEYHGTKGDSNDVTSKSASAVVRAVIEHSGIPIPAHADRNTGSGKHLLAVKSHN